MVCVVYRKSWQGLGIHYYCIASNMHASVAQSLTVGTVYLTYCSRGRQTGRYTTTLPACLCGESWSKPSPGPAGLVWCGRIGST